MAALENARHEKFCQERVAGKTIDEAYEAAGYKRNPGNAGRLNNNEHIQSRITELQSIAAEKAGLSKEWVLERLMTVAERCMQAEAVKDHKGKPTGEYKFDASGANRALELLGKEQGMFKQQVESNITVKHEDSMDAVQAELERRRKARDGESSVH
jgi:phage terminase small subunit